jgi:hypothetical protein
MRFGHEQFFKPVSLSRSAALSVVVHATLIGAFAERTQRDSDAVQEQEERRVIFFVPRDRTPLQNPAAERLQWVSFGVPAESAEEFVDAPSGQSLGGRPAQSTRGEDPGLEEEFSVATAGYEGDTVFSVLEVEEQARRYEWSAAPVYPPELLRQRVEGKVAARYVVDTTGWADMRTFVTMESTHPEFAASVRAALPIMRFAPARLGTRKVRQLVEQEFSFKLTTTASAADPPQAGGRAP